MIGAVETGRHLPRVDAALAMATALGVGVSALFGTPTDPQDVLTGITPSPETPLRIGWVGDRIVSTPSGVGLDGWEISDGEMTGEGLNIIVSHPPGLVVAGCEPGLSTLERVLRERGIGALAVASSSRAAIAALDAGRVHAAVVHGPTGEPFPQAEAAVIRIRLARWRVGLAAPADAPDRWWIDALRGRGSVIQREAGAGVQDAFLSAVASSRADVPGPRVRTHLEAARIAVATGMSAVTIEPAALGVGGAFHALETHEAHLLIAETWKRDRVVVDALEVLSGGDFRKRLERIGGYDLTRWGDEI